MKTVLHIATRVRLCGPAPTSRSWAPLTLQQSGRYNTNWQLPISADDSSAELNLCRILAPPESCEVFQKMLSAPLRHTLEVGSRLPAWYVPGKIGVNLYNYVILSTDTYTPINPFITSHKGCGSASFLEVQFFFQWQAAPSMAVTPSMVILRDCWMLKGSDDNHRSLLVSTSKNMQNNLSQVGSS